MENRLNDLTGSQWLFWTNTVWETNYPVDATHPLRRQHGAMKPPEAMREIIEFFTKKGETVLDPFAGVGGTLLGAELCGRKAVGFEIDPRWADVYESIRKDFGVAGGGFVRLEAASAGGNGDGVPRPIVAELRRGDCLSLLDELPAGYADAIITDPPYGAEHGASGFADETNFSMVDGGRGDLGAAPDFETFYRLIEEFGRKAWRVLKDDRYLVVLCGDRYKRGAYIPLGVRVADRLVAAGFQLKGIKIWSNKATLRPLKPYAVKTVFVPNITHQNLLILRKEVARKGRVANRKAAGARGGASRRGSRKREGGASPTSR